MSGAGADTEIEFVDERAGSFSLQTFERDEQGRVVTVETTDGDSSGVVGDEGQPLFSDVTTETIRLAYADGRLVSLATVDDRAFTPAETRTVFEYTDEGLLDRLVVTALDTPESTDERLVLIRRPEYESPACAEQSSKDPRVMLVIERPGIERPAVAATRCGFWADDDL